MVWLTLFGMTVWCWTALAQRRSTRPLQFPAPMAEPPQNDRPAVLKMRLEEGRVTAEITDCPMQNALKELAERTGVIFEVRSQQNPLVSVHLNHVPLAEAIQRIAAGSNTMFFYGRGKPGSEPITRVRIYPRENEPVQPSILYLGTGAVTKSNDPADPSEQALRSPAEGTDVE